MCGQHGVHVCPQAQISVNAPLIELDLNEAVRVGTDNEVNLSPINHNNLLYVVNDIRELLLCDTFHTAIHLCWLKLTGQNFILFYPLGSENVFLAHLIWII